MLHLEVLRDVAAVMSAEVHALGQSGEWMNNDDKEEMEVRTAQEEEKMAMVKKHGLLFARSGAHLPHQSHLGVPVDVLWF